MVPILILAAGASSRMRGEDKLVRPVRGAPLLRERAEAALATGTEVLVALPAKPWGAARRAALNGLNIGEVMVDDPGEGMAASLRAGLAALPDQADGVLVMLADMPEITTADLRACLDAFDGKRVLRGAGADGTPGHPVVLPRHLFPGIAALAGDTGARALVGPAQDVALVPLPARHALCDLDTPEDWATWEANEER